MHKIILTNDFLFCSLEKFSMFLWHILTPIIKNGVETEIVNLQDLVYEGETFSRKKFFELSQINDIKEHHYLYDIKQISEKSWEYFFRFIPQGSIFLGFELGLDLRKKLTDLGFVYINFWVHSFKLFDDVPFMINTNNIKIWEILQNYKIPKTQFEVYSAYWKTYVKENCAFYDKDIIENSAVFIGQTLADKSIEKDGKYLNILDFKNRLELLSTQYNKIYYLPHPSAEKNDLIEKYIRSTSYINKLNKFPTYYLLISDKIKKVLGISSSVLYEAQFFNKDIEYLYQPLFDIDTTFGLNSFTSVMNDYYNPSFWKNILSPIFTNKKYVVDKILITDTKNKIRKLKNLYYGYAFFDDICIIKSDITNLSFSLDKLSNKDNSILQKIFYIKNEYNRNHKYKVFTILGIKFKFMVNEI